jgi:hypothetical protein
MDWFTSKGQIVQVLLQISSQLKWPAVWGAMTAALLGVWGFFAGMSWAELALVSTGIFGFSMLGFERFDAWRDRRRVRSQSVLVAEVESTLPSPGSGQLPTKWIEFYDSRSEKNNIRGDLEKELKNSTKVWFASIAGDQISQLAQSEVLGKFERIIINNPESGHTRKLAGIQPVRGKKFPDIARLAIEVCRQRGKVRALRLSENFVLNVVISDPDELHAWARVQVFLPYFEGHHCPSFIVCRKDRPDLFGRIKESFEKMWEEGKVPPSEETLRDTGGAEAPLFLWQLPPVDGVLWAISELKKEQNKIKVRILASEEGYFVADLMVWMFRLAEWSVQSNPVDAKDVFLLPRGKAVSGVHFLLYEPPGVDGASSDVLTATRVLAKVTPEVLSLELQMIFSRIFPRIFNIAQLPGTTDEFLLQIEVGARPY